jgi:hypothetical protein
MPTPVSDNPSKPFSSAIPTISVHGYLVTGSGFLPDHNVAIRITRAGEDISDYLTYTSDADGCLSAPLPETAITETGRITVTDHRPDPAGDCGLLWSNTVIVAPTGT